MYTIILPLDTAYPCYGAITLLSLPFSRSQLTVFWLLSSKSLSQRTKRKSCCPESLKCFLTKQRMGSGVRRHQEIKHSAFLFFIFLFFCFVLESKTPNHEFQHQGRTHETCSLSAVAFHQESAPCGLITWELARKAISGVLHIPIESETLGWDPVICMFF